MKNKTSSIIVISDDSRFNTSLANECYIHNIDISFKNDYLDIYTTFDRVSNILFIIDFHIKNFNNIITHLNSKISLYNTILVFNNNEHITLYRKSNSNVSDLLFKKKMIIQKIKNIFNQI